MLKCTEKEALYIKGGDLTLLLQKLKDLDATLTKNLKYHKDDLQKLQGAAQVVDALLKILQ